MRFYSIGLVADTTTVPSFRYYFLKLDLFSQNFCIDNFAHSVLSDTFVFAGYDLNYLDNFHK
jgi:hypothetical protein